MRLTSISTSTRQRARTDHLLIFAAIGAALATGVVLGHQWWLGLGAVWLVLRVIALDRPQTMLITVALSALTVGLCLYTNQRADRLTLTRPRQVAQQILVNPDQINVNGNLAVVEGQDLQTDQRETLFVTIRSPQEKSFLEGRTKQAVWQVRGELRPLIPATNFNQFDYRQFQRAHHIYNELNVDDWHVRSSPSAFNWFKWCHETRAFLNNYFATMPQPLSGYCKRLLIGENDRDTQSLMTDVKRLGIIHLFCISGMHVVLLTTILRRLMLSCYFDRQTADWLLIVALPAYLIIGGGSASLIRAVLMAEADLLGRRFSCSRLDTWAASLVIGIWIDPYVLLTLGGQLSYLLSLMLQVLPQSLNGWQLSAVMNLVSLPSLLSFVYEVHLLSFVSSYVMIPFFSVAIFPVVIVSALTYPVFPFIGDVVNGLLTLLHQFLASLAQMPGMIHFGRPSPWLAMAMFCALIWLCSDFRRRSSWMVTIAVFVTAFVMIHWPLSGEVTFVDIGQGDCIIVRAPFNRSTVMIDTGGKLSFASQRWQKRSVTTDQAERTSINYLKSLGISHLDAICLSHHDTDHIGYLPTVLKNLKVDNVVVPAGMERQPRFIRLAISPTNLRQPKIVAVKAGDAFPQAGLTVLHPFKAGHGENTDSMVLRGTFGQKRFLFTGDLDKAGEQRLMRHYPDLAVDVLKLGHHGSKTASSKAFLRKTHPAIGIISAGRFNRYGHPNNATMQRLKETHVKPVSTQQYGMIRYRYFAHRAVWQTKLQGDELKWMLPPYDNS